MLIDKLVEECIKNIDGNGMIYNGTLNDYKNMCRSCTIYIILFTTFFMISASISSIFTYSHWYLKRRYTKTRIY